MATKATTGAQVQDSREETADGPLDVHQVGQVVVDRAGGSLLGDQLRVGRANKATTAEVLQPDRV